MQAKPITKWFYGVDSIRFTLAILVVLSHFDNVYAAALKNAAYPIFRYAGYFLANAFDGVSAVIAFFIISGFVIHYPNKNGIVDLREFWIRRLLRILIPLLIILAVGSNFNHPEKAVVWSLYCELIYYAIYPILLKINTGWKSKFFIAFAVAGIAIFSLAYQDVLSLIKQTNINYKGDYWQLGVFLTWIVGLPCWLLGVLIAENIDNLNKISFSSLIKYRILVYLISCILSFGKFHFYISYIISMNIFAFVLYKWIQNEIVYFKNNLPNPILEKMGKFSYSIYLNHPLFLAIVKLFLTLNLITYPIAVLTAIGFAYLFYRLVEKPAHFLARKINNKYNSLLN